MHVEALRISIRVLSRQPILSDTIPCLVIALYARHMSLVTRLPLISFTDAWHVILQHPLGHLQGELLIIVCKTGDGWVDATIPGVHHLTGEKVLSLTTKTC